MHLKRYGRFSRNSVSCLSLLAVAGFIGIATRSEAQPAPVVPAKIDYNADVLPILSNSCFRCHGPDRSSRKADLRLDNKDIAYAKAIVPGDPDASELVKRITSTNPAKRMPLGGKLGDSDIATLKEWIRQGAEYKPNWSFIPPVKVTPPQIPQDARAANAIDKFVIAGLAQKGLKPSPEADKATLINRVTLQLTGLPPTLEEVDAFLGDKSPNAYENVVDRLLASPAYGENMAAYWMNIARYSESDGFLDDHHDRLFWPYRDWVISAFNKNMPFNQFSTWQLAGDLLPNATKEQRLATAFLRVGKRTTENGAINEEYQVEYALERANVVGFGFLALTTGCARCHDHKYDPISQKDYYSLSGFFNSSDEPGFFSPGFSTIQGGPTLRWTDDKTEAKISEAESKLKSAEAADANVRKTVSSDVLARVQSVLKQPSSEIADLIQKSVEASTVAYYPFETTMPIPDDQLPTTRTRRGQQPKDLVSPLRRQNIGVNPATAPQSGVDARLSRRVPNSMIRENLLWSPSGLPNGEPAVLEEASIRPGGAKGNAFFFTDNNRGFLGKSVGYYDRTQPFSFDFWFYPASEYENVHVIDHRDDDNSGGAGYKLSLEKNHLSFYMMHSWPYNMLHIISKQQLPVKQWSHISMTYDGSSRASGLKLYLNGQPAEVDVEHDQLTESSLPRSFAPSFNEFVGVEFGRRFRELTPKDSGIDEIRFFNRALTPLEVGYLHKGAAAVEIDKTALRRELAELQVVNDPRVIASGKELYEAREAENQAVSWVPEIMVMADAPKPKQTYILNRGLYNQHLDPVDPAPLTQIFAFDPSLPKNRIGLTKWLFDPKNPLVSRVFVNRMWQQMFGRGLVETADDFGTQGSRPTYPQLLDWLAVDFVESGWDMKRLNKMIAMSETFRQSSDVSDDLLKRDPNNTLLARGPRMRMSAEQIRDNALAVSGLLLKTIGGPSVHPYQPEGVWVPGVTVYSYPKPDEIPADEQHRRSLYTFVKRNTPPPSMMVFDFSERHQTVGRRLTSNTPLQALDLLNDPQYLEAYRVLATRVLKAKEDKDEQIRLLFRIATRRFPTDSEIATLRPYYDSQLAEFDADRAKAEKLIHIGVAPVDDSVDVIRLAALTNVAAAVMNTPDAYSIH